MNRTHCLTLDTDHFSHLHGGARIQVARGTLWVTIDGEPDDSFLERGQSLTLPPHAHALVQAFGHPAQALVREPDGWRDRLAQGWRMLTQPPTGTLP